MIDIMIMAGRDKAGVINFFYWFREKLGDAMRNAMRRSDHQSALLLTRGTQRVGILIPVKQGYRFESDAHGAVSLDGREFVSHEHAIAALNAVFPSPIPVRSTSLAGME